MNELSARAKKIRKNSFLADIALGFEPEIEVSRKWDLLTTYQTSGFHLVGLAIAGHFTSLDTTMHYLARHRAKIQSLPHLAFASTFTEILSAKKDGKLAVTFWLQGTTPLGDDLHMLEVFHALGVRHLLLCYNTRNSIGDGCVEPSNAGLSRFGQQVIHEMNRLGMLVDLSHAGIHTSLEAMALSQDPVIFSHSNADAIAPHVRNLKKEQLLALAKNGGTLGVSGSSLLLGVAKSSAQKMADHLDYLSDLIGPEHLSLGLDVVYFHELLDLFFEKAGAATYPKGYLSQLDSFRPEQIDALIEELLIRKYKESAITGILGENFLRVLKTVWR